jgi:hypothetical protein
MIETSLIYAHFPLEVNNPFCLIDQISDAHAERYMYTEHDEWRAHTMSIAVVILKVINGHMDDYLICQCQCNVF